MKYKGSYFNMWDAWFLNDHETIHAFHLKAHDGENWNVGHVYTEDLLHFKKMCDVLETLPEEKYPDDCLGKFTGCAVEKDGVYYLFYTMRDRIRSEKIGLAISHDLEHFEEYEHNPVLVPDENIFAVYPKGQKTDFRDLHVVFDEERGKYLGYFAAMANIPGRGELGVVGMTESADLIHWENQKIVYVPEFNGVVEVPNIFKLDGKWYLTLLTGTQYGAKGAVSDPNISWFTIWASADSPDGPFLSSPDNIFLGSTMEGGYTCRCFDYHGKTYVMYIDRSEYGASISLPKEVRVVDEKIVPCYTDILQKLRTGKSWNQFTFDRVPTAWAWGAVVAGTVSSDQKTVRIEGVPNSFQAFQMRDVSAGSLETEFTLSGDFSEAGLVFYCSDQPLKNTKECFGKEHTISLDRKNQRFVLYENSLTPVCCRNFDFTKKDQWHIRVLAMEGQLEVYVDDVLLMQRGLKTEKCISAGLFAFDGRAEFRDLKIYELEQ